MSNKFPYRPGTCSKGYLVARWGDGKRLGLDPNETVFYGREDAQEYADRLNKKERTNMFVVAKIVPYGAPQNLVSILQHNDVVETAHGGCKYWRVVKDGQRDVAVPLDTSRTESLLIQTELSAVLLLPEFWVGWCLNS